MKINNLIARFLANKATKEEWEQLEVWKNESKDNLEELLEMQSLWDSSHSLKDYKEYDKAGAWDKINASLQELEPPAKKNPKKFLLRRSIAIAASFLVLVFSYFIFQNLIDTDYSTIAIDNTTRSFELPDGSSIDLNRYSKLDYAVNFEENRSVKIAGEVFFEVKRNEEYPFTIQSNNAEVQVLGTRFNIKEFDGNSEVFVVSGSVKVTSADKEVVLNKNERVLCTENGIEKLNYPGRNYLSWKSGKLIFDDTPLHKVVSDLKRHFGTNLVFSSTSKAMNLKISDEFINQDFESIMENIVLISGIDYIKKNNKYIIQ